MSSPWDVQLWLDENMQCPFHTRLANGLIKDIQQGRLKTGTRMPGSRSLAKQLGVNRKTVQLVYEELESQGWLFTRPRRGTFVADVLPEQGLSDENKQLVDTADTPPSNLLDSDPMHWIVADDKGGNNDGVPDARLISHELLSKAYRQAIIHSTRHDDLGYHDPRGLLTLRHAIRDMLVLDRFMKVEPEQVCIVRGSQMGIYLVSKVLDPTKGVIVCEELSYPPAIAAFESNGFQVVRCRLDKQGLDTQCLQEIIARHPVAAVYTTPHHQYPTTVSMSMDRRLLLLALSKQHQFWVIEDDYDHEFHYNTKPIPPLSSLPNAQNVIHIGSMSKVFAPALRLGYVAGDQRLIDLMSQEILLIDRQGNSLTELATAYLMSSGAVKKHIRKVRKCYQQRRDFALQECYRLLGHDIVIDKPAGGMALWVKLPEPIACRLAGLPQAVAHHKDIHFAAYFNGQLNDFSHVRFGYGALNEQEITQAVTDLAQILEVSSQ